MGPAPNRIRFRIDDDAGHAAEVAARMADLLEARKGWVNLRPIMTTDDGEEYKADKPSGFGLFSKPPPAFPEATWVPGGRKRTGESDADTIGVAHPLGRKAGPVLVEAGVTLPEGWRVLSDNVRRGLVIRLPARYEPMEVVDWLLRAANLLSPIPLDGLWQADVHPGI